MQIRISFLRWQCRNENFKILLPFRQTNHHVNFKSIGYGKHIKWYDIKNTSYEVDL